MPDAPLIPTMMRRDFIVSAISRNGRWNVAHRRSPYNAQGNAMTALLFRDDPYLGNATARVVSVTPSGIELERTIFYPQGGGQMGDTGVMLRANGDVIAIADTRKGDALDSVLHMPAHGTALPEHGETLPLQLDWPRRYALMRLHTALHVMSCVVVAPVTGGNIASDKARLDFDIDMSLLDARRIEQETNALIAVGIATDTVWLHDG